MGQQMRIQILSVGFKWLKIFSPKIAIKRECTSRWNYETGGCDNCFDATDPLNSCSDLGKFKNLNNNNVKHVTKFQRREVGAPLSSY